MASRSRNTYASPPPRVRHENISPNSPKSPKSPYFPDSPKSPYFPDSPKSPKSKNSLHSHDTRLTLFRKKQSWLESISHDKICSLSSFGKIKQFTEGAVGKSFGSKDTNIAIKVVDKNERSEKEIEWYNYFTKYVAEEGGFPHFPLIYQVSECDDVSLTKTFGSTTIVEPVKKNAFLILSELAEGTLKDVISKLSEEEMMSMIFQVLMGCLVLENKKVIHNDLEPANILFYSRDKSPSFFEHPEYIEYMLGDITIRAPHHNRLYVLWDFGMMVNINKREEEEDPRKENDMISTLNNDLKMTFLPRLSTNYVKYTRKYKKLQELFKFVDYNYKLKKLNDVSAIIQFMMENMENIEIIEM